MFCSFNLFLGSSTVGAVEEHQYYAAEQPGVMGHRRGKALDLFFNELVFAFLTKYLCKAHDDIKWCTYLVGDVLNEGSLLTVSLLHKLGCMLQFFIAQFGLVAAVAHDTHVEVERL